MAYPKEPLNQGGTPAGGGSPLPRLPLEVPPLHRLDRPGLVEVRVVLPVFLGHVVEGKVGIGAVVMDVLHVAVPGLVEGMKDRIRRPVELERQDAKLLAERQVERGRRLEPAPLQTENLLQNSFIIFILDLRHIFH